MDAVQEVGLWGNAVELCGLDDGHGARQGFRTGVGPAKSQFLRRPLPGMPKIVLSRLRSGI